MYIVKNIHYFSLIVICACQIHNISTHIHMLLFVYLLRMVKHFIYKVHKILICDLLLDDVISRTAGLVLTLVLVISTSDNN
jgi:hypothetical protein